MVSVVSSMYPLYHTLNKNIESRDMTKQEEYSMTERIKSMEEPSIKAILMLIIEHSRINGDGEFYSNNIVLPYNGSQNEKDVVFQINKLPIRLKWIIWKFIYQLH